MKTTSKHQMIRLIITEALQGEPTAAIGLIHYLHYDKNYPLYRIVGAANRLYKIPPGVLYSHLYSLVH